MSLWSVPDREAHQLMAALYCGLAAGLGCATALQAAQLELRASHPDVAFWGAFICQGDPGPIAVDPRAPTQAQGPTSGVSPVVVEASLAEVVGTGAW